MSAVMDPPEAPPAPIEPESLDLAFDFVKPAYEMAERRFNAIESRLQSLLTYAITVAVGAPVVVKAMAQSAEADFWFYVSMWAFLVVLIAGSWVKIRGGLSMLDLATLHKHFLKLPPGEFRENVVFFAARHQTKNTDRANAKGYATNILTIFFAVQAGAILAWVISQVLT